MHVVPGLVTICVAVVVDARTRFFYSHKQKRNTSQEHISFSTRCICYIPDVLTVLKVGNCGRVVILVWVAVKYSGLSEAITSSSVILKWKYHLKHYIRQIMDCLELTLREFPHLCHWHIEWYHPILSALSATLLPPLLLDIRIRYCSRQIWKITNVRKLWYYSLDKRTISF